jgi:hypothetical protein
VAPKIKTAIATANVTAKTRHATTSRLDVRSRFMGIMSPSKIGGTETDECSTYDATQAGVPRISAAAARRHMYPATRGLF